MDYSSAPKSLDEIFKLIARAPSGRETLEKFLPLYTRQQVRIQPYPATVVSQLREAIGPDQPIGACFENDGRTGTIYYDSQSPLGVTAVFVFHEIVHALDPNVWKGAELLDAEVHAFERQHRLTQELKERLPEFEAFLRAHLPRARILHERLNQLTIAELYGFKAPVKAG